MGQVKKLKKEIGEKNSASIHYLRQLLPFPKMMCEVIVTEPFGTVADAKGNKAKGLHSDKKQGLQVQVTLLRTQSPPSRFLSLWDRFLGFLSTRILPLLYVGTIVQ